MSLLERLAVVALGGAFAGLLVGGVKLFLKSSFERTARLDWENGLVWLRISGRNSGPFERAKIPGMLERERLKELDEAFDPELGWMPVHEFVVRERRREASLGR